MKVLTFDTHHLPSLDEPLSLALGNFDGMHLGHAEVLFSCVYEGTGVPSVLFLLPSDEAKEVYSFLPKKYLMSIDAKDLFASSKKMEMALHLKASPSFYGLEPEEFIENVLKKLNVKEVFCGEDYSFGKGGKGNVELLKKHFKVHAVPLLQFEEEKIASRRIKESILSGDIERANALLGHPFQISSKIEEGYKRGRSLGFPTANLAIDEEQELPPIGVYYGVSYVYGLPYPSIINIGNNPTFQNDHLTIEVHMMDYEGGDLYGKTLYVDFLGRLRDEIAFAHKSELIQQLEEDKSEALRRIAESQ